MEKPSKAGLRDETERIKGSQSWSEGSSEGKYSGKEGGRPRWNRPNESSSSGSGCQREGREQKFENRRRALQWDGQAELQGGGAGRWPEVRERRVGDWVSSFTADGSDDVGGALGWSRDEESGRVVGFSAQRRPWKKKKKKAATSVATQGRDGRRRDED